MMFDKTLRVAVVKILGLEDATEEDQDVALLHIENIATKRLVRAVPEMLTDEQLNHVESMRSDGEADEKIVAWIQEQLPGYGELLEAVIKDVAEEIARS